MANTRRIYNSGQETWLRVSNSTIPLESGQRLSSIRNWAIAGAVVTAVALLGAENTGPDTSGMFEGIAKAGVGWTLGATAAGAIAFAGERLVNLKTWAANLGANLLVDGAIIGIGTLAYQNNEASVGNAAVIGTFAGLGAAAIGVHNSCSNSSRG